MPRLTQVNPTASARSPLAPAVGQAPATGLGSPDPGRVTTPFVHLGALPSDPTDLPDDGVCRMWFRNDISEIRVAIGGTVFKLDVTAA